MEQFSKRFGVDLSRFEPRDYFGPEGFNLLWLVSPRWWRWRRTRMDFTAGDLVEAARRGTWVPRT
jgi:hypothetical protein